MMKPDIYKKIKKKYGQVGSWAIWSNSKSSDTSDLEIFKSEEKYIKKLHTNFIFVGLNISQPIDIKRPFGNFHGGRRDFMLRDAIEGSPLVGSYMTDIIKFYENKNSRYVLKYFKKNDKELIKHISLFKKELNYIGATDKTILIALGNGTYEILKNANLVFKVSKLTHYSSPTLSKKNYKKEVNKLIKSCN